MTAVDVLDKSWQMYCNLLVGYAMWKLSELKRKSLTVFVKCTCTKRHNSESIKFYIIRQAILFAVTNLIGIYPPATDRDLPSLFLIQMMKENDLRIKNSSIFLLKIKYVLHVHDDLVYLEYCIAISMLEKDYWQNSPSPAIYRRICLLMFLYFKLLNV